LIRFQQNEQQPPQFIVRSQREQERIGKDVNTEAKRV